MKLQIGRHQYSARLRYLQRMQTWVIAIGAVLISPEGLRRLEAEVSPSNDVEARQLSDAGFEVALPISKAS
jgi:hypothetical protein